MKTMATRRRDMRRNDMVAIAITTIVMLWVVWALNTVAERRDRQITCHTDTECCEAYGDCDNPNPY